MTLVTPIILAFVFIFDLSIPFWIPAAMGLYLLTSRRIGLNRLGGFLTLKPILTTPIWAVIISFLHGSAVDAQLIALWSILPGASLTLLVLTIFRRLFFGSRSTLARVFILLDCTRWINSGLLTATGSISYYDSIAPLICIFALIGLIFPTAYAVVALTTTLATQEHEMAG